TVDQQDRVPGQMEILRSLQIESVNLRVASKKATGDSWRKCDALSPAREQRVITRIKDEAREDFAFKRRSSLRRDEGIDGVDVKNVNVLQCVSQGAVHVSVDWLAHLKRESVIALVIVGAQIIRFGIKHGASEGKTPIQEIRFCNRKNKVFALGA